MATLPAPPPSFAQRKRRILAQLAVPDAEYTDASPKGSVDAGIRDLIDEINALDGLVTTSSCGGRVSVFLEGRKARGPGQVEDAPAVAAEDQDAPAGDAGYDSAAAAAAATTLAGVGGKGGGGTWLFVSHDPVQRRDDDDDEELQRLFGLEGDRAAEETAAGDGEDDERLIHFKFEPMILHILAASPEHAQLALRCGLQAGFRESGAVNLVGGGGATAAREPPTPMVAIRCMGLTFESLVGVEAGGRRRRAVSPGYLGTLLRVANERFAENTKRIERFRAALREATAQGPRRSEWEDAAARRERKRAEGLRRAAELRQQQQQQQQAASSPLLEEVGLEDR